MLLHPRQRVVRVVGQLLDGGRQDAEDANVGVGFEGEADVAPGCARARAAQRKKGSPQTEAALSFGMTLTYFRSMQLA